MTDSDHALAFEAPEERAGMEIVDRIEQERCFFRTNSPVSPSPAATDAFRFPVDRAVRMDTDEFALPNVAGVLVRDGSGEIIAQVEQLGRESLPAGRYGLELLTQFKTYVVVDGPVEIASNVSEFTVTFDSQTEVLVGARSNHDRPATTVTTTEDPVDMMAAVETFGSALKTTAPDRSFPSLRGHPPAVELGDALDVPSSLKRPETGIRLEIPARRDAVYVAAPLAYYLGADIEPGPTAKLVTEDGFEHTLSGRPGYQQTVERTLKQVFFLDCITRTEGLHKLELHERTEIERLVDLDFESLYQRSLAAQVEAYLDVPYSVVEEHVPDWRLTTHVEPVPRTIEQLPFVVDDLAIVRTRTPNQSAAGANQPETAGLARDDAFTRSTESSSNGSHEEYVEPQSTGSLEQAWIGENIPIGASKLTREAFENRIDRSPVDGDISITIVLNDPRMDEERDLVDQAYGNRDSLPFDVDVHRDVTVEGLRELLQTDAAFLHYIGHTEQDGFECADGKLDARELEETGVQAFLLNACNSYEQGLSLIEAGGVGGIVTLNDVINEGAVKIGETVARLLNGGFPLRASLTIARDESVLGGQYIVVGDGGMTVAQPVSGAPVLAKLSPTEREIEVEIEAYATDVYDLGSLFKPNVASADSFYLNSGKLSEFSMNEQELLQFLSLEEMPVRVDGELHWSSEIDLDRITL